MKEMLSRLSKSYIKKEDEPFNIIGQYSIQTDLVFTGIDTLIDILPDFITAFFDIRDDIFNYYEFADENDQHSDYFYDKEYAIEPINSIYDEISKFFTPLKDGELGLWEDFTIIFCSDNVSDGRILLLDENEENPEPNATCLNIEFCETNKKKQETLATISFSFGLQDFLENKDISHFISHWVDKLNPVGGGTGLTIIPAYRMENSAEKIHDQYVGLLKEEITFPYDSLHDKKKIFSEFNWITYLNKHEIGLEKEDLDKLKAVGISISETEKMQIIRCGEFPFLDTIENKDTSKNPYKIVSKICSHLFAKESDYDEYL